MGGVVFFVTRAGRREDLSRETEFLKIAFFSDRKIQIEKRRFSFSICVFDLAYAPRDFLIFYFIIFIFSPNEQRAGGGGCAARLFFFFFSLFSRPRAGLATV